MRDVEEAWIERRVPEASTPAKRDSIYAVGKYLVMMLEFAARAAPPASPASRNRASIGAARAWDQLNAALEAHPTFELFDLPIALHRHGVDVREAAKYVAALRAIIDGYRDPAPAPGGRPRTIRAQAFGEAIGLVMGTLSVTETRAAEIVADMATELLGESVSADSLRIAKGRRRMKQT